MHVCMYICMYACMHLCMYLCMHILHLTFLTGTQDSTSSILEARYYVAKGDCFIRVVKCVYIYILYS